MEALKVEALANFQLKEEALANSQNKMASQNNLQITQGSTGEEENRPTQALIAQARALESTGGKHKWRSNSDTTKIALNERYKQSPDEHFTVRVGKLFCNACREVLCAKKMFPKRKR